MTETFATTEESPVGPRRRRRRHPGRRAWHSLVLAPVGDGSTRRRASDAVRAGLAAIFVTVVVLIIASDPSRDQAFGTELSALPNGVHWLTTALYYLGSFGVIVMLALIALASRRAKLARDTLVSGLGVWLLGWALSAWLGMVSSDTSSEFPLLQLAAAMGVAVAVLPYLSRPARRFFATLVLLGALGAVLRGSALPMAALASLALGWGFGALVHLIFGSPTGLPSADEVAAVAADLGLDVTDIAPMDDHVWGVARFLARADGDAVEVSVYGRDAADAQVLGKAWRFLWYRDSGPTLVLSRLQQVEHEAFLAMSARQAGLDASTVLAAGMDADGHDAALITRPPAGRVLADLDAEAVTPAVLGALFAAVRRLRAAGMAHGSLSGDTIVVADDGSVGFRDFRSGSVSATDDQLDRDLAGALVSAALVVGPRHAVDAVGRVLGAEALSGALAHLQPAALDRATRAGLRHHKGLLDRVRDTGAEEIGADVPKLQDIRRVSWGQLGMAVGLLVGVYLVAQQFAGINDLWATLQTASWEWVVVTFVLAQATNLSQTESMIGSVASPLPFGPSLGVQLANAYTGLVAGTLGTTATIIRYFQRRGLAVSVAVSSGVLVTVATMVSQVLLFTGSFIASYGDFNLDTSGSSGSSGGSSGAVTIIVLIVAAVLVGVALLVFLPRLRHQVINKLRPQAILARQNLDNLRGSPAHLVRLFGGAAVTQIVFALTLGAALHAYGASLPLTNLIVINTLASLLGGIMPVPGGLGVIETGLIAGFTAAGIPSDIAVAATLTARLFTCYLPPVWGYPSLVWLRRRDYL